MKIHFGCGNSKASGYVGVDIANLNDVDIVHDLNIFPYPFESDVAKEILLVNILEHLPNTIAVMEECWRICKNNALVKIQVPYYNGPGASQDPTHVRFFTENSFDYFTPDDYTQLSHYNYYTTARFHIVNIKPEQRKFLYRLPQKYQWFLAHHLATVHGLTVLLSAVK